MSQVANNADDYANARLNIFFPGVVPSLDGQCVSLAKWFMAEMTDVPDPQAARGDARYVGKTLVAQGHAIEVPYDQRQRGDLVCYEYGVYGHIGVILSGNRTFEENVNWQGVRSRVISDNTGSWTVYASRIGSMAEAWRHDMHIYRIKSYNEKGNTMPIDKDKLAQGIASLGAATHTGGNPDGSATPGQISYWVGRFTDGTDVGTVLADFGAQVLNARNTAIDDTKPDIQKAIASLAVSTNTGGNADGSATQDQIDYWTGRLAIDPTLGPILADFASQVEQSAGSQPGAPINKTSVIDYINKNLK